jgi:hypothetical protein
LLARTSTFIGPAIIDSCSPARREVHYHGELLELDDSTIWRSAGGEAEERAGAKVGSFPWGDRRGGNRLIDDDGDCITASLTAAPPESSRTPGSLPTGFGNPAGCQEVGWAQIDARQFDLVLGENFPLIAARFDCLIWRLVLAESS